MVWNDIGQLVMKNALRGYNCTVPPGLEGLANFVKQESMLFRAALLRAPACVSAQPRFAYGQSGCGKSYSVVGDPPNLGIIPRTVQAVFEVVDGNTDPDVRYHAPPFNLQPAGCFCTSLKLFLHTQQQGLFHCLPKFCSELP